MKFKGAGGSEVDLGDISHFFRFVNWHLTPTPDREINLIYYAIYI